MIVGEKLKGKRKTSPTFVRETFTTSRLLDYFTRSSLERQMGCPAAWWAEAALKEAVDNGLDAAEKAGVPPVIEIKIDGNTLSVADNGAGFPLATLRQTIDYSSRTSDKAKYNSPTRGQQGQGTKTLFAMEYALSGTEGRAEVHALDGGREVIVTTDPILQEPKIAIIERPSLVKNGTLLKLDLPSLNLTCNSNEFLQMASGYALFNPHASITIDAPQGRLEFSATNPTWEKWRPKTPIPSHWYTPAEFGELVASMIRNDRESGQDRTVRELVAQFSGLASTAKQKAILGQVGLSGKPLSSLLSDDGKMNQTLIPKLLGAMQAASREIRPERLGVIGESHFRARLADLGADLDTFRYGLAKGTLDGVPYVLEVAFGYSPDREGCDETLIISGINSSPSFQHSPFLDLTDHWTLDGLLQEQRCGSVDEDAFTGETITTGEPVIVAIHLTTPKPPWSDTGKRSLSLDGELGQAVVNLIQKVTKAWTKQRKQEEREASARAKRRASLTRKRQRIPLTEAMLQVVPDAYAKASGSVGLAFARQVMYAARGPLQEITGETLGRRFSQYFSQKLLPDFCRRHPELTADWDIVYDARGHFTEPHTRRQVPIGTLQVRSYISDVESNSSEWVDGVSLPDLPGGCFRTWGPSNRYSAILFCEKEGFGELFSRVRLCERFDIALMSTKGNSVVAARRLIDSLTQCAAASLGRPLPIFVLHDFDVTGFTILGMFRRSTDRYQYATEPNVIDMGLRLSDAQEMGLESERVYFTKQPKRETLEVNGATEVEIEFLLSQRRIELNAMTSPQLVSFIESKLREHGVGKIVPGDDALAAAYRQASAEAALEAVVKREKRNLERQWSNATMPPDLPKLLDLEIEKNPELPWDEALRRVVRFVRNRPNGEDRTRV